MRVRARFVYGNFRNQIWLFRSPLVFWLFTEYCVMFTFEGRKPSTKNIGLESVGVELEKSGAIKVSSLMDVSCMPSLLVKVVHT
jgi:hypothetical protein